MDKSESTWASPPTMTAHEPIAIAAVSGPGRRCFLDIRTDLVGNMYGAAIAAGRKNLPDPSRLMDMSLRRGGLSAWRKETCWSRAPTSWSSMMCTGSAMDRSPSPARAFLARACGTEREQLSAKATIDGPRSYAARLVNARTRQQWRCTMARNSRCSTDPSVVAAPADWKGPPALAIFNLRAEGLGGKCLGSFRLGHFLSVGVQRVAHPY